MAYEIPTTEPLEVILGDLIKWKKLEDSNFPISDGWVLTYNLVTAGSHKLITCTDNGDNHHLATITASISAGMTAGTYKWQSVITLGDERYKVDDGEIILQPNFAALTSGYDGRSHAEIVLDAIEATIEGRASKDQLSYTISGRQLSRTPVADLLKFRDKYRAEVESENRAELIKKGLGHSGRILVRM